jgi:GT2 family glycosyltransferase
MVSTPSVTLVVVPRERFSYAEASLESIYRKTSHPFELIYIDVNSPAPLSRYLRKAATDRGFRLIRTDEFVSPNQARNIGLREVRTKYVVFIDNDVEVEPGWLDELVACAEETGAWAVAPLYFEGDPKNREIHMAGGTAEFSEEDGMRTFREVHLFPHRNFDEVGHTLDRHETGFFEFHAVLLPMAVFDTVGPLDERFLSSHEHMDLSLLIRRAGGAIYLAPASRVTHTHGLLDDHDLRYVALRWSDDWNRRSTRSFIEKWNIDPRSPWVEPSIAWRNGHREHLGRMRRSALTMLKMYVANNVVTRGLYAKLREARAH